MQHGARLQSVHRATSQRRLQHSPPTLLSHQVLYFVYREHAASKGRRVQVLPRGCFKTFREWFLDLKDDYSVVGGGKGSQWQPTEAFRETNNRSYYVPPLPRHLLQAMGAEGDLSSVKRPSSARLTLRSSHGTPDGSALGYADDAYGSPIDEESPADCSDVDSPGAKSKSRRERRRERRGEQLPKGGRVPSWPPLAPRVDDAAV